MGLGLHGGGVGSARWLAAKGAKVTVTDLKTKAQLAGSIKALAGLDIKFVLGKHRQADFRNVDLVIQNPGVPRQSKFLKIAERAGVEIATDMSIFFSLCPAPIIGITGTKGKSTTTALLGEIFKKWKRGTVVAGNIRKSPLDFLHKIKRDTPVILELSSWQLEGLLRLKQSPHLALITNIYLDHLNRYKNFKDYLAAKKIIYTFQTPDDFIILNYDNEATRAMGEEVFSQRFWFSKKYFKGQNGAFVSRDGWIVFRQDGKEKKVIKRRDIKLSGEHNLENVLATAATAMIYGAPVKIIREAVGKFRGLEGRTEVVRRLHGIQFVNDTTATAPAASVNALKTLKAKNKNIILIAGGADKKLEFRQMAKEVKKSCKAVILMNGNASTKLRRELKNIRYPLSAIRHGVESMEEAVEEAYKLAERGDIILLSPGAASFGLFNNEFDRGEKFVESARNLSV